MKKYIFILFFFYSCLSFSQGAWTKQAGLGSVLRAAAVGFSIGTKGYIGTGYDYNQRMKDFWEWDQATDIWTQKADFAGTARDMAVGFSIGTKGYIGTGWDDATYYNRDFWEWNQTTNVWTRKADFAGTGRYSAVGFSIGTKGYIGIGQQSALPYKTNDFWEWDQANDTWTQKTNFGGTAREGSVGFSIGTKGYIGTGNDGNYKQDFWEWDQANDTWTQKADFRGDARELGTGFSIGTKGYIGTGSTGNGPYVFYNDFWEWDQANDMWTQKASFGGIARAYATGFSIGSKGYIGTGYYGLTAGIQDFWEYCDTCVTGMQEVSNLPNISVYPNPFSAQTILRTSNFFKNASLRIYDPTGQQVKQINNLSGQAITLHREGLPNGLYFLSVIEGSKIIAVEKIVIVDN